MMCICMLCGTSMRVSVVVVGIACGFIYFTYPVNCFRFSDTKQVYLKTFTEKAYFGKMTLFPTSYRD